MPTLRESLLADITRAEEALAAKKATLGTLELTAADVLGKEMDHLRDIVRSISRHLFAVQAPVVSTIAEPAVAALPTAPHAP